MRRNNVDRHFKLQNYLRSYRLLHQILSKTQKNTHQDFLHLPNSFETSSEVTIPSTFPSLSITGNALMLCFAIRFDAISKGSSGLVVTTRLDTTSASAFTPSAMARVISHEVTIPVILP